MKQLVAFIIITFFALNPIFSQESYKREVTWMGLDFTEAKMFPSTGFSNPEAIRDNYLEKWNGIILTESKKFNVAKFFRIETLTYELSEVKERNLSIPFYEMVVDDAPEELNEQSVISIVAEYQKAEGIGLVFIVDSFDQTSKTGTFWATFFDRSTQEVLSTKKIKGLASGVGLRNYWANSIYNAMKSYK